MGCDICKDAHGVGGTIGRSQPVGANTVTNEKEFNFGCHCNSICHWLPSTTAHQAHIPIKETDRQADAPTRYGVAASGQLASHVLAVRVVVGASPRLHPDLLSTGDDTAEEGNRATSSMRAKQPKGKARHQTAPT